MTDHNLELPFWEGFIAAKLERRSGAIWIVLRRCPSAPMVCGGCGHHCYRVHESGTRIIRELPMLGQPVWLRVPLRRLRCGQCGPRTERVSWLDRHARITRALADFVGANEEVDRAAHRVVVGKGSAYDLFLTRTLQYAQIERSPTSPTVVDTFLELRAEVAAGVKQQLEADTRRFNGLRLLDGRFMVIQQAMGTPKSRGEEAAAFLSRFVDRTGCGLSL